MNNTIVEFGYNTSTEYFGNTSWEGIGSKYNFNVEGNVLGVFSCDDKDYLLSVVTRSFGDNCMAGTVDAREIVVEAGENSSYVLLSNNELSQICMQISRMLSTKEAKQALSEGKNIEQMEEFQQLMNLGINLERKEMPLEEKIIVCGVEQETFDYFREKSMVSSK